MSSQLSSVPTAASPKQNGFIFFVIARLLCMFGMQIQAVIVAWQVYDLTNEPMSLAYVGLAQFIPIVLCIPIAGDVADRFSRKTIIMVSLTLAAVCSLLLMFLSYEVLIHADHQAEISVLWFYVVLVIFGIARSFFTPTFKSILPQIVERSELARAISSTTAVVKIATIAGPALGGVLYTLGGSISYLICFVAFAASVLCFCKVHVQVALQKVAQDTQNIWLRFKEGLVFIKDHPIVLGCMSLDLFAVLLGGVVALLPMYAKDILHTDASGLGILRSAMAVGEISMAIILSRRPLNHHVGLIMFIAVAVFGLANLVFAISTLFWLSVTMLVIAGAADMTSVYVRSNLLQFSTPDYIRGRVTAVNMLFTSTSNELGEFRAGTQAAWFGVVNAGVVGALSTLFIVGFTAMKFSSLLKVQRFEDAENHNTPTTS
ncbi:MFS transporter [Brackiella oedipodis]|uniref:MFS transporter n=1 Tax=Brackiella oedipodis TaxID=124225 RepID=UPI0004910577|nr:MFS transporter [Brackiella oedipodis]